MSSTPDPFELIKALLNSAQPQVELPDSLRYRLLQAGAVQALLEDASAGAVELLEASARVCPAPDAARQALDALQTLARRGNPEARASLFRLALEENLPQPVEWIRQSRITSPHPWQNRCFAFLHLTLPEYLGEDPHLEKLLRVFLTETPTRLQERLLAHAQKMGLTHWVEIAAGLSAGSEEAFRQLVEQFSDYTQHEKTFLRSWLAEFAQEGGLPAQNALCELFLAGDDNDAGNLALQHAYQPADPAQRALFLFLTEQWRAYEVLDFTHRLLNAAYESAGPTLRQRILNHSRLSGHIEWLQSMGDARRRRWLKDLSDADWRSVLRQLETSRDWQQAWRLITHAPPLWAAQMIDALHRAGWRPDTQADELDFLNLVELAQRALAERPDIFARQVLKSPAVDIQATAVRGDGKCMAAGGSDSRLYLWDLPSGERSGYVISSPTPGARALAISPDGQNLAAAFADNNIRIFRIEDGRHVKTFEGHNGLIRSLLFHSDGRTLFSAAFDGTLRAWRFPLGPEYARLQPGMGELFSAAIHPAGENILLAGQQVQIWRWAQGVQLQALPSGAETTLHLALAGDLPLLAGYSRDRRLRIWNVSSGRLLQQIETGTAQISALALSARGDLLVCGDRDGALTVWNTSTGELLERMQVHEKAIVAVHWFADAAFVSASQDGRLVIWDARLLSCLRQPLDAANAHSIADLQAMRTEKFHSTGERTWLSFLVELVRWKSRFDILLEESRSIRLDEFDIEL